MRKTQAKGSDKHSDNARNLIKKALEDYDVDIYIFFQEAQLQT